MPLPDKSFPASGKHCLYNPTAIWWPHPSAFDDLTVEETENGFEFSAPEGTECADWLAYFSETPERRAVWEAEVLRSITELILQNKNGESKGLTDEQAADYSGGEKDGTGPL